MACKAVLDKPAQLFLYVSMLLQTLYVFISDAFSVANTG